jgi:broad specificity phosphatase PhoE
MPNEPSLLVVARHGSTYANEEARFSHDETELLSPKGKSQCELLQKRFKQEQRFFAHHFCGNLLRQIDSARLIAPDAAWETHFCLNERRMGDWAGRLAKDMEKEQPEAFEKWHQCAYVPPGAEPLYELQARVQAAMEKILRPALQDGPVLVVTSAMVIAAMLGSPKTINIPPSHWFRIGIRNTSLTVFNPTPRRNRAPEAWDVEYINDFNHLPESCR